MSQPLVDVIIPNLNKEEYINACIKSLLKQDFKHWRCIVVDGGSEDGSWEVLKKKARQDDRFVLYRPGKLGLYPSWNYGLEKVSSKYVAILTSDDVWSKNFLSSLVYALESAPKAVCAVSKACNMDAQSRELDVPSLSWNRPEIQNTIPDAFVTDHPDLPTAHLVEGPVLSALVYALGSVPVTTHSLLMRTEEIEDQRFSTDVGSIADREWYLHLGTRGQIILCDEPTAWLRRYSEQATSETQMHRDQLWNHVEKILDRNKNIVRSGLGVDPEVFGEFDEQIRYYTAYQLRRPSLDMLKRHPLIGLRRLSRAAFQNPRLTAAEVFYRSVMGETYTMKRRRRCVSHLLRHDGVQPQVNKEEGREES